MRNCALIILFSLCFTRPFFSQQWAWDTLAQNHQGDRLCKDIANYIYSYNVNDSVLTKMSAKGKVVWQKSFPGNFEIRSVACSPDSSVYLLGNFTDQLSLGINSFTSYGLRDLCVCKLTSNGTFIWCKQIGSKGDDFGGGIAKDGLNLLITGAAGDTTFFPNYTKNKQAVPEFFVGRFFANGLLDTVIFAHHHVLHPFGNSSVGEEVAADHYGNIIVIVDCTGELQIDTTILHGYSSTFLYKFNSSFSHQWHYSPSNTSIHDYANELTITPVNEIIFAYHNHGNHQSRGDIVKLSPAGAATLLYKTQNTFSYGEQGAVNGIDLDTCGNIYFTGFHSYPNYPIQCDIFFVNTGQLSPSGNINWLKQDSAKSVYRMGCDIVSLDLNEAFVTVRSRDSLQLNQHIYPGPSPMYASNQANAIIQATFGIPWNTTSLVNQSICANNKTTLQCGTGGYIQWYNSANSVISLASGNSFTTPPLSAGVYTWYAEATTCTMVSGRLPITVTVNALPVISVTDGSICPGHQFVMSPSPFLNYSYSSGSPSVSPASHTTYTIIGNDLNGCNDTALVNVYVRTLPSISVQQLKDPVCIGEPLTISLTGGLSYSVGNTPISNPFTFVTNTLTVMLIKTEDVFGCEGTTIYHQKVAACTDINEAQLSSITIFPNPSSGSILIQGVYNCRIALINSVGVSVMSKESDAPQLNLNISGLSDGVYFLKVDGTDVHTLRKIILKK